MLQAVDRNAPAINSARELAKGTAQIAGKLRKSHRRDFITFLTSEIISMCNTHDGKGVGSVRDTLSDLFVRIGIAKEIPNAVLTGKKNHYLKSMRTEEDKGLARSLVALKDEVYGSAYFKDVPTHLKKLARIVDNYTKKK